MNYKIPIIQINNLKISYNKNIVLSSVDLNIMKGDYIVISGGNGSGKSSLIKAILGLIPFKKGEILFNSVNINQKIISRNFGYVPQYSEFLKDFPISVEEVIKLECSVFNKSCPFSSSHHLNIFNAGFLADRSLNKLSGGELQKVILCRALITDPMILILDEPTNNLDKQSTDSLIEILKKLWLEDKKTIIHITHQYDEVGKIGRDVRCFDILDKKLVNHDN